MNVKIFRGRPARALGAAVVLCLCIALVPAARSALSLREAARARAAGDPMAETAALDRALLEAPPWAVPVRARAARRLETLAAGHGSEAWYAALALVSASRGADRRRWQARCLELLGGGRSPREPLLPVDPTPPSATLAAVSSIALVAWIGLAAAAAAARDGSRRRFAAAAGACWLLWLVTLVAA